jgi:hypothetical protein
MKIWILNYSCYPLSRETKPYNSQESKARHILEWKMKYFTRHNQEYIARNHNEISNTTLAGIHSQEWKLGDSELDIAMNTFGRFCMYSWLYLIVIPGYVFLIMSCTKSQIFHSWLCRVKYLIFHSWICRAYDSWLCRSWLWCMVTLKKV